MKKINLNLVASESDKKISVSGKLYFWERVECVITGMNVKSVSTVHSAIFDGDTQVVSAINFQSAGFNAIYCEFPLQTEALQSAMSDTAPNAQKDFTIYVWDQYEEEMVAVGKIPIYNNPYINDEIFENITVLSNFAVQYSSDGGNTWTNDVPEHVSHIRLSVNGGATWQDKIYISPLAVVEVSNSNSITIDDIDTAKTYCTVHMENGISYKMTLDQLGGLIGPVVTIYEE